MANMGNDRIAGMPIPRKGAYLVRNHHPKHQRTKDMMEQILQIVRLSSKKRANRGGRKVIEIGGVWGIIYRCPFGCPYIYGIPYDLIALKASTCF